MIIDFNFDFIFEKESSMTFSAKEDLNRLNRISAEGAYFMNWASKRNETILSCSDLMIEFRKHLKENKLDATGKSVGEILQLDI